MFRVISAAEIAALESRRCTASDWGMITVEEPFVADSYYNVSFSGAVRLGSAQGEFTLDGGVVRRAGITDATLHNVSVGRGVCIRNIRGYIANYDIADGAYIENVDRMVTHPGVTFGIGTEVSVLNETGGREVPVYERLSAQTAYIAAMYRHLPALTSRISEMIRSHADGVRSDRGRVGVNARVTDCGTMTDVWIGDYARVEGAASLSNGWLASSEADPVEVGRGVMASEFVMASGSKVSEGVVLRHVFVGQGTHLSHLFSAHDSLFFANCACENGEACAIFAGPYTVTMHKSSLLIAGMFSFLNAGSGSNQSNHMYKLGPIHQGVVERGSKTTSDSYVLWPARIGAFSLVMGRHVSHSDTSKLPFSYLIERKGKTYLVPGVNLKSVGTIRDARKWPHRDCRRDPDLLDQVNFNLLSPYTISRMMAGIEVLDAVEAVSGPTAERYTWQGMTIEARALRKGRGYYSMAIDKFMGNSVIKRLEGAAFESVDDMRRRLRPTAPSGAGEWVDIGGMLAPKSEISALIRDLIEHRIDTLDELESRFRSIHAGYYDMEWTWVVENFRRWWGKDIDALTPDDVAAIVERWRESVVALDRLLYDDARKEFSLVSRTGFGVDGAEARQQSDFEAVRGQFDADPFVCMVLDHIDAKTRLGQELLDRLAPIR